MDYAGQVRASNGVTWTDRACFAENNSFCTDTTFEFFDASQVSTWPDNVKGVIGLSPADYDFNIVRALFTNGAIKQPIVGFSYALSTEESSLQLGYIDSAKYTGQMQKHEINPTYPDIISFNLNNTMVGDNSYQFTNAAILSSAVPYIYFPNLMYSAFI